MRYTKPKDVTSPKDLIKDVKVIYDGGEDSFSLANVTYKDKKHIAIRWNVAEREYNDDEKQNETKLCVGTPSSSGFPLWFILPKKLKFNINKFEKRSKRDKPKSK